MESNSTVLSVGVAAFAFVVTFFVYRSMGCTVSARVNRFLPKLFAYKISIETLKF